jgi:SpoVK/Ycf46/Vps4 family AAA+-type ATPase
MDYYYQNLWRKLQNDANKSSPSIDLILELLSGNFANKIALKSYLTAKSKLFKYVLLQPINQTALLHGFTLHNLIEVSPHIVNYILGETEIMPLLSVFTKLIYPNQKLENLILPDNLKTKITTLTTKYQDNRQISAPPVIIKLIATQKAGQKIIAEAICQKLGYNLLIVNIQDFLSYDLKEWETIFAYIVREAIIKEAIIYWDEIELLNQPEKKLYRNLFIKQINKFTVKYFFSHSLYSYFPYHLFKNTKIVRFDIASLNINERLKIWHSLFPHFEEQTLRPLAYSFQFEMGQIFDIASYASSLYQEKETAITLTELQEICQAQAHQYLSNFTKIIKPIYHLNDLVLSNKDELKEIINWLKYKENVYEKGGFSQKLSLGKGLIALFAGPSGTGKTMAAEVIAHSLQLLLYKVNLANILSKFVGETEQHLDQLFEEAKNTHAILFFDEADALFGKRGEVKEARDNYANIQTSYLLQKVEEYSGMIILSSNLKNNMDDAFTRRLNFLINFQMPGSVERIKMWQNIWPKNIQLDEEIDISALAQELEISGGNIRNIALSASFKAVADYDEIEEKIPKKIIINSKQLLHAVKQELRKTGRIIIHEQLNKIFTLKC